MVRQYPYRLILLQTELVLLLVTFVLISVFVCQRGKRPGQRPKPYGNLRTVVTQPRVQQSKVCCFGVLDDNNTGTNGGRSQRFVTVFLDLGFNNWRGYGFRLSQSGDISVDENQSLTVLNPDFGFWKPKSGRTVRYMWRLMADSSPVARRRWP